MMRPELVLTLVSLHVPVNAVWRLLVCRELRKECTPCRERLSTQFWSINEVKRRMLQWRIVTLRSRHYKAIRTFRYNTSWQRSLHDMEAPIMLF